jgi:hypothetical protein
MQQNLTGQERQKAEIDWHAFSKARKGVQYLDHFIPKLCAGWLPTYYHLNKTEGLPDECPLCKQSEATDNQTGIEASNKGF